MLLECHLGGRQLLVRLVTQCASPLEKWQGQKLHQKVNVYYGIAHCGHGWLPALENLLTASIADRHELNQFSKTISSQKVLQRLSGFGKGY